MHRHVYGKWVCRCCQTLVQPPSAPQIVDGSMASAGLLALVSVLGVFGAALFYGDSVITPAISVLSAVEGLEEPLLCGLLDGGGCLVTHFLYPPCW